MSKYYETANPLHTHSYAFDQLDLNACCNTNMATDDALIWDESPQLADMQTSPNTPTRKA